ncbi:MAG: hypothetical protein KAR20_05135 [Candidatus Heimdallarchaeota archaeon]|nr:hypothetical protein [Candidatus Heimdallarchaeota archaeon]
MANEVYQNVINILINNGIHEEFAHLFVRTGLKKLGASEESIDEKIMGLILQQHVYSAIQMFVNENEAKKIIHKITLSL